MQLPLYGNGKVVFGIAWMRQTFWLVLFYLITNVFYFLNTKDQNQGCLG